MYKNQLQELAQRSCFNLPSYTCIREGPDHAPRFKAVVTFNGESFESPHFFSTLRQAEHAAAEVALSSLSSRGPSHSLAARILDETGVYKNLLQEISQRVGAPLPHYTTFRSGLGHQPVFTGTVELAGIIFTGEPAKNKKQAEKNAALSAWTSLKQSHHLKPSTVTIARALLNYRLKERMKGHPSNTPFIFPQKYPNQSPRPSSSPQRPPAPTSKILPFICQKQPLKNRSASTSSSDNVPFPSSQPRFSTPGASPYIPFRPRASACRGMAPPVTIRNSVPCFSAPPSRTCGVRASAPPSRAVPPVCVRSVVPVHAAAPPPRREDVNGTKKTTIDGSKPVKETMEERTGLVGTTMNVKTDEEDRCGDSKTAMSNGKKDEAAAKVGSKLMALEELLKQLPV
ncbi:hypothetical protein V2J09_008973 [Rumex salicifolius]